MNKRQLSRKKIFCVYQCVDGRPDELQKPENRGRVFPKRYIGYTNSFKKRRSDHYKDMTAGCIRPFHNYLRAVYREHHNWSIIIEGLTEQQAKDKEKALIKFYDTNVCRGGKGGYNATDGGDGTSGYKYTEEQRKAKSEAMRGENNHQWGKPHTKEHKKKQGKAISKALTGVKYTAERIEIHKKVQQKKALDSLTTNPMQCIRKKWNKYEVTIQQRFQGSFKTISKAQIFRDNYYLINGYPITLLSELPSQPR